MYQIGDLVFYGSEGICRVEEIGIPALAGLRGGKEHYTMAPLFRNYKVYVPVDAKVYMRPAMTREQALELIDHIPQICPEHCEGKSWRFQGEHYHAYMESHNSEDLVRLLKTVHAREQTANRSGKRVSQMDERYRKRAQDMLYGELSVALNIPLEEVDAFICRRLDNK